MAPDSFCVFVLTHGRPGNVLTLRPLLDVGRYSGPWFLVVDDEDPTLPAYIARYGEARVLTFSKEEVSRTFDPADLSSDRRTVVYARNACWALAKEQGFDRFLQLDDDYTEFRFRYVNEGRGGNFSRVESRNLDRLFTAMLSWLDSSGAATVALAQSGDFIGGAAGTKWQEKVFRKAMNTFFCRASDTWRFPGRVNEDVNAYSALAHRGHVFLSTAYASIQQELTQSNPGGMTGSYQDGGTYIKSFYPVMMCPSAVRVGVMPGPAAKRIHHHVSTLRCAPCILPETFRKATA